MIRFLLVNYRNEFEEDSGHIECLNNTGYSDNFYEHIRIFKKLIFVYC